MGNQNPNRVSFSVGTDGINIVLDLNASARNIDIDVVCRHEQGHMRDLVLMEQTLRNDSRFSHLIKTIRSHKSIDADREASIAEIEAIIELIRRHVPSQQRPSFERGIKKYFDREMTPFQKHQARIILSEILRYGEEINYQELGDDILETDTLNNLINPSYKLVIIAVCLEADREDLKDYLRRYRIDPNNLEESVGTPTTQGIRFLQMCLRACTRYFSTLGEPKPISFPDSVD